MTLGSPKATTSNHVALASINNHSQFSVSKDNVQDKIDMSRRKKSTFNRESSMFGC